MILMGNTNAFSAEAAVTLKGGEGWGPLGRPSRCPGKGG